MLLSYLALATIGVLKPCKPLNFEPENLPSKLIAGFEIADQFLLKPGIVIPPFFQNALKFYHSLRGTPPPLLLGPELEIYFPVVVDYRTILYCVLDTVFSLLSIDDILTVLSAALLDGQILVIGQSLQEVSHCVLAFQALLKPFDFCGQVIPILPSYPSFLQLLDSPTPFIIGVPPSPDLAQLTFMESAVFVQLDKRIVSGGSLARFPGQDRVKSALGKLPKKQKSETPHPFGFPRIFRKYEYQKLYFSPATADLVVAAIREPLSQLGSDFVFCFFVTQLRPDGSKGVTAFNAELFLAQLPEEDVPFFKALAETQNFELYMSDRIAEYLKLKGEEGEIGTVAASEAAGEAPRKRTKSLESMILG
jgi:hypothetical protein